MEESFTDSPLNLLLRAAQDRDDLVFGKSALLHQSFRHARPLLGATVGLAVQCLVDQRKVTWTNRAQLLGVAAEMMRRILVNYAGLPRGAAAMCVASRSVSASFRSVSRR